MDTDLIELTETLVSKSLKLEPQFSTKENVIPDMGAHLILDFADIPAENIDLDDMELMDNFLTNVITSSLATIEGKLKKKFEP